MNNTIELYPRWLRLWHWLNVVLFLVLLVSGFSLHFAGEPWAPMAFAEARTWHNVVGMAFTVHVLLFFVGQGVSGGWVHYVPRPGGLVGRILKQAHFYGLGIFRGDPHPFPMTRQSKFNPMQQVTYLGVMLGLMPALLVSGWLFLFPEWLPDHILGWSALLPVALIHYGCGLFLALFMVGHLYLATAGESVTSEFRKMVLGHRL